MTCLPARQVCTDAATHRNFPGVTVNLLTV
jgi:hypothetical protein